MCVWVGVGGAPQAQGVKVFLSINTLQLMDISPRSVFLGDGSGGILGFHDQSRTLALSVVCGHLCTCESHVLRDFHSASCTWAIQKPAAEKLVMTALEPGTSFTLVSWISGCNRATTGPVPCSVTSPKPAAQGCTFEAMRAPNCKNSLHI